MDKLTNEQRLLKDFRSTWLNEGEIIVGNTDIENQFPDLICEALELKKQINEIMDPICDWIYDKKLKKDEPSKLVGYMNNRKIEQTND